MRPCLCPWAAAPRTAAAGRGAAPGSARTGVTIGELFERLRRICGVEAEPVRDDAFWRPTDRCTALCTDALRRDTGWVPSISLDQTLIDILASLTDRA